MIDPIAYYSPETYLFPALAQSYADTGAIDPMALYLVLDWKAPRARTLHRSRLAKLAGSFNRAVSMIAAELDAAANPEQQLRLLLTKWGFRLPTATAILAVLYPETFTIYDIRVCNTLGAFRQLGNVKWSRQAVVAQFEIADRSSMGQENVLPTFPGVGLILLMKLVPYRTGGANAGLGVIRHVFAMCYDVVGAHVTL
ncbi:MAG: hypothetical protein ACREFP_23370 [Acetobacteraceae bacterium]